MAHGFTKSGCVLTDSAFYTEKTRATQYNLVASAAPNQTVAEPSNFLLSKMPAKRRANVQSGARLRVLGQHLGGGGGRRGSRATPAPAPASREPTTLANGESFERWERPRASPSLSPGKLRRVLIPADYFVKGWII